MATTKKKTATPSDLTTYHLTARGCSGKGVRARVLSPTDVDDVLASAAKEITSETTMAELARIEQRTGVEAMMIEVTRSPVAPAPPIVTTDEDGNEKSTPAPSALLAPGIAWEPWAGAAGGQLNAKDWGVLMKVYATAYNASPAEVDEIMGKAFDVAVG